MRNAIAYTEQELSFTVGGNRHIALLRIPARLARRPALLVKLAGTRRTSLDGDFFRIIPDIFLAAGHRVASFDLPNHGDLVDAHGEGLVGMAAAIAAGDDVFAAVREIGVGFIDLVVREGLAGEHDVLISGTSRGGLAALHVMSADARVHACAVHAPLTHIPVPEEFAHLSQNEIVTRSNATALVPDLADRPISIDIGTSDPRVSAEECLKFHAALSAASRRVPPVLFTAPGESHGAGTFPSEAAYHAAAGFLLCRHAAYAKQP